MSDDDTMFEPLPKGGARRSPAAGETWRAIVPVPADAPPVDLTHGKFGAPSASWPYHGADGALLGYAVRFDHAGGKEVLPHTYCGNAETGATAWRWKSWDPPRPIYRLDQPAARPDDPVILAEGEKAADAAARLLPDHVAVAVPGGSNAADKANWQPLGGRLVVIWPDRDGPGWKFAADAVRLLKLVKAKIRVVVPPEGPADGWDAADAEAEGWDTEQARALVQAAKTPHRAMRAAHGSAAGSPGDGSAEKGSEAEGGASDDSGSRRRLSISDRTMRLIDPAWLWHSPAREAYASLPIGDHIEHWPIQSRDFRLYLRGALHRETGKGISGRDLADAVALLEAIAVHDGPEHPISLRVGRRGDAIYLDLCDEDWAAVEITAEGWRVVERPPIKFLRTAHMRALPEPERGVSIEHLKGFLNLAGDEEFQLVVAWLLQGLSPEGDYPVLALSGPQGSAKTTVSIMLRELLDPHDAPIRSLPRNEHDMMVAVKNSWVQAYDNLSRIKGSISDALCRIATGGGFVTRELHSDTREVVITARRPQLLNGITEVIGREDLADRSIVINLLPIPDSSRRSESELLAEFRQARPGILGALLDGLSSAMANQATTRIERLPRLADFAILATAAEPGLGFDSGSFLAAYRKNREQTAALIVESDTIAIAVRDLTASCGCWRGSAGELLTVLTDRVPDATRVQRDWPNDAVKLGLRLRRLAPALERVGVELTQQRLGRERKRIWILTDKQAGERPAPDPADDATA